MATADVHRQESVESRAKTTVDNEAVLLSQKSQLSAKLEKDKKIGHRRVDDAGQVTYKKKTTSELMSAIQLGIGQSVGRLAPKARRDVLYADFHMVETVVYPRDGGPQTPKHHYSDFSFKTYAPVAFQYFRGLFDIQSDDYMLSLCNEPLHELSNPGASGSIFYITEDDEFIIKTVQRKEAEFLQKLLPGYYMNLTQNRATLLPKFYGLYCYQCSGKNIRFVVMNNLLPSSVKFHAKYDLKGSTHKRRASNHERTKSSPTFKDLDFMDQNPEGILLETDTHEALWRTIERDCRVLQSFKIMDYSMLLAIHNLDQAVRDRMDSLTVARTSSSDNDAAQRLDRSRSVRQRVAQYSTALESIQLHSDAFEMVDGTDIPSGGIPARNGRGDHLLLFIGIIDVLQSYRFSKKLEHTFKAMVSDGDTVSVHRPGFYAQRFQSFIGETVFRKLPPPLRYSPSKRKSMADRQRSQLDGNATAADHRLLASLSSGTDTDQGAVGGHQLATSVDPSHRDDVVVVSSLPLTVDDVVVSVESTAMRSSSAVVEAVVLVEAEAASSSTVPAALLHSTDSVTQSQLTSSSSEVVTSSSAVSTIPVTSTGYLASRSSGNPSD